MNVSVDAQLDLKNQIDYTNVNFELIWKNLQAIVLGLDGRDNDGPPQWPLPREITPEMVQGFLKQLETMKEN